MRYLQIMEQNSNITSEIDAIIARAMAEYQSIKGGEDPFTDNMPEPEPEPEPNPEIPDVIPANSNSILVSEETSRFSSAVWFENVQSKSILLAGLGGIGSYVAFLLSRLHPHEIALYDADVVEPGNMSGQLYSRNYISQSKTNATVSLMMDFSSFYDVTGYNEPYTEYSTPRRIMICGFDNMEARRIFFNSWKTMLENLSEEERKECLYIDGRLAAESLQVLCMRGDDTYNINRYEHEFLFSDAEADETVCSYKQTTFMANMIGSIIVNLFVNFCANECDPLVPRDLPFFTEYSADTMYFKTIA